MSGSTIYDPNWRDSITPLVIVMDIVALVVVLGLARLLVAIVDVRWWLAGREVQRNRRAWHASHPDATR